MNLTLRLVIFFAFFASACFGRIAIGDIDSVESKLVEATVKILSSCYGDRATPVGLSGKSAGTISKALWSHDLSPVTLIDDTSRILNDGPIDPKTRYKLQVFVVSASSPGTLAKTLKRVKTSAWWNHMAAFLILDWPPSSDDCSNTFEMLWTAWEMNILNANLMCQHRTKGRLIYTFNPYTSQAPKPWRFESVHRGMKDHPWTLFVREYRNVEGMCNELDFEKTRDLGGYEIRVSVGDSVHRLRTKSEGMCFDPIASDTCSAVIPAFNATLKLITHGFPDSLGHVDDKGNPYGILKEVAEGNSDVGFNSRALTDLQHLPASYPHHQSELYSVTRYRGYKSQLSKICSVIDKPARYSLAIVILITVLFFKYLVRASGTAAIMNTFRIICNTGITNLPGKLAPRIYLGCLFLFAVTMHGIFQGRLASVLTNPEPLRDVDTMQDLRDFGHTVYGFPGYDVFFNDRTNNTRFVAIKGEMCTRYVLSNPKAACVAQTRVIVDEAANNKLHLSRKVLAVTHVVLPIRPDWPLEKRLNKLLLRSADAGLRGYLNRFALYRARLRIKLQEDAYRNEGIKVLTMKQLGFAFVILGIGLGLATVSFVVEVILGWIRPRMVETRKRFRHRNNGKSKRFLRCQMLQ